MDPASNPMLTFFTPEECATPHHLYTVLALSVPPSSAASPSGAGGSSSASAPAPAPAHTPEEIRKAYRRAALKYHPDKHAHKSEQEKAEAGRAFQKVGFAYLVLGDAARRKRYDATGETGENAFEGPEGGWEAYFEAVYTKVDKRLLDEDKARYQGSDEERTDILAAYTASSGSLDGILSAIPHSSSTDEPRIIALITAALGSGELQPTPAWTASAHTGYEAGRAKRVRAEKKEAMEAERQARKLGVWDEFYGGAKGEKGEGATREKGGGGDKAASDTTGRSKTNGKAVSPTNDDEADTSALAALIQSRQKQRASAMDALVAKYEAIGKAEEQVENEGRAGKRRKSEGGEVKGKSGARKGAKGGKAGKAGGKGKGK